MCLDGDGEVGLLMYERKVNLEMASIGCAEKVGRIRQELAGKTRAHIAHMYG